VDVVLASGRVVTGSRTRSRAFRRLVRRHSR
jgi:hypothetical protein